MLTGALIMLGFALAFVVVEMTVTWVIARKLKNYGIVDAVWALGFTAIAIIYFWLPKEDVRTWTAPIRWEVLTALVVGWSVRLACHLAARIAKHHPAEDVRYARLRVEWEQDADWRMLWFFQLQGLLQVVLSVPMLVVNLDKQGTADWGRLGWTGCLGIALWLIGLLGESLADRQLARFRADPANKGKVCQTGLWNYSRHPNYFFEWLVWVGYAVFALGSPWGWLGLIAPALMLHFLLNVTGIPMTEELSLKSKGDAYRDYQRTTSAFVPWFKKSIP